MGGDWVRDNIIVGMDRLLMSFGGEGALDDFEWLMLLRRVSCVGLV